MKENHSSTIKVVQATGDWLADELAALGCDEGLTHSICFALGQRQAMLPEGADLWAVAYEALERYKRGGWDTPGHELAIELCREAWGDPPDLEKVRAWLRDKNRTGGPGIANGK